MITQGPSTYHVSNSFDFQDFEGKTLQCSMMPDPQHLIKSIRNALFNNKVIYIHPTFQKEAELTTNEVTYAAIWKVVNFIDKKNELKILPRVTKQALEIGQFTKMKVNLARAVLSQEVAKAIEFCVANYPHQFTKDDLATAFFCKAVSKWYDVVTAKNWQLALSLDKPEKYEETIKELKWFMSFYSTMKLHPTQQDSLKPSQKGVLLSTTSLMGIAEDFLKKEGFRSFRLGLANNDPIENLNSVCRQNNPKPTVLEYLRKLKAICMCQLLKASKHSSYDQDEDGNFLTDLREFKEALKEVEKDEDILDDEDLAFVYGTTIDIVLENDVAEDNAKAFLAGYTFKKTICSQSKCEKCESVFVTDHLLDDQECNILISLRDYKPGALKRPSKIGNELIKCAETVFRIERDRLVGQDGIGNKLAAKFLAQWQREFPDLPTCHLKLIAERYAKIRLHFWAKFVNDQLQEGQKETIAQASYSSKPMRADHLLL